jgi:hypothetical protein
VGRAPASAPERTPARRSPGGAGHTSRTRLLSELAILKQRFGAAASSRKRALLRALDREELRPAELLRLHELLCFWRAYPDDALLLRQVERMLRGFAARPDLRRHAARLADSGIAGTEIFYSFYADTARWLARGWPRNLTIDWPRFEGANRVEALLPLLAHPAELPALDELALTPRDWLRRMRGARTSDAVFLALRFAELPMSDAAREILYDQLDVPWRLSPGEDTPSRTLAKLRLGRAPIAFQRRALSRERLLPGDIARLRPRAIRAVTPAEGERLVDLARGAMVTRARDLDVFSYADPRDVRLVDFGHGLQFACMGARPERRLLLEAVYGYLTLKNGVPIGYVLTSTLFGSAEMAYNVFDTWRGAEAGPIYARVLAMTRLLFGCDTFTIVPYQLGEGNDEAIDSGAWWFYQKMGFRPRTPAAVSLMNQELARMRRDLVHRSSAAILRRLARHTVHLDLGRRRDDVLGRLELPNVGLHVMRYLAATYGAERERAAADCAARAAELLRVTPGGWSIEEAQAFERWAALVLVLPGVEGWSAAEKTQLAEVVRAKGSRRESDFVRRFDDHKRLRRAIARLAAEEPRAS